MQTLRDKGIAVSNHFCQQHDQMDKDSEITFEKIKQFLRNDPFVPFILRVDNKEIEVSHPNAVAFHPEVPYLTVYDKTEIYDLSVDKIAFVQRQHVH